MSRKEWIKCSCGVNYILKDEQKVCKVCENKKQVSGEKCAYEKKTAILEPFNPKKKPRNQRGLMMPDGWLGQKENCDKAKYIIKIMQGNQRSDFGGFDTDKVVLVGLSNAKMYTDHKVAVQIAKTIQDKIRNNNILVQTATVLMEKNLEINSPQSNFEKKPPSVVNEEKRSDYKAGHCYIATAVYGSYDCPQVWVLRRYRDNSLNTHLFGKIFIKLYYVMSPLLIGLFGKTRWFNSFWKKRLDKKIAKLKSNGYLNTPYND